MSVCSFQMHLNVFYTILQLHDTSDKNSLYENVGGIGIEGYSGVRSKEAGFTD